jgi:hypothetical protein
MSCWICDREIYSLLFWNEEIGTLKEVEIENEQEIINYIKEITPKPKIDLIEIMKNKIAKKPKQE